MKAFPNTNRWSFKKLHKPDKNFFNLFEYKVCIPLHFEFGIQAVEPGKLTFKHLESCRRALRRALGKKTQILFRIFTGIPVSQKPMAARMGKGKGALSF